jgi:hypothetical protein
MNPHWGYPLVLLRLHQLTTRESEEKESSAKQTSRGKASYRGPQSKQDIHIRWDGLNRYQYSNILSTGLVEFHRPGYVNAPIPVIDKQIQAGSGAGKRGLGRSQ